jgi:hypothetical protein
MSDFRLDDPDHNFHEVTPEVYESYLKARYLLNKRTPEAVREALGELDAALAELNRSLEVARARNARYEVALALNAIARARERFGSADAAAQAEADGLFRTLGVVRIADVPLDVTVATRSLT